nr:reverse transcriptase domain-containing protein [Candidatus Sigynarchaeum springense]
MEDSYVDEPLMDGRCETSSDELVHTEQRALIEWKGVDWSTVQSHVEKIQQNIFRETRAGNFSRASKLQKLLVKSLPARLLAVRRVTEHNRGRLTPGIDGVVCIKDADKVALVESLRSKKYNPVPSRVVWIPKPNVGQRRLGILTMLDRAKQAIVMCAMDPEWEAKFEPHSFGYRPGRSAIDAVQYIGKDLMHYKGYKPHPGWVLDADISKCFDNIDHDALLAKIKGSPFYSLIQRWLKSGAISDIGFEETERGTPQGGVISPLLANIALTGLESQFGIYSVSGRYLPPSERRGLNKGIMVYRLADDFIILAPSKEVIEEYVLPKVRSFLAIAGLNLNEAKTRITNVSDG